MPDQTPGFSTVIHHVFSYLLPLYPSYVYSSTKRAYYLHFINILHVILHSTMLGFYAFHLLLLFLNKTMGRGLYHKNTVFMTLEMLIILPKTWLISFSLFGMLCMTFRLIFSRRTAMMIKILRDRLSLLAIFTLCHLWMLFLYWDGD